MNNKTFLLEDIQYICNLISQQLNIPLYFISNSGELLFEINLFNLNNPLYTDKRDLFKNLFSESVYDYPFIKTTKYYENYACVNVISKNNYLGSIIIGPSVSSVITSKTIDEFDISLKNKSELRSYFMHVPIIEYKKLLNSGLLIYYIIYNIRLDLSQVANDTNASKDINTRVTSDFEANLLRNREQYSLHATPNSERQIFQCVTEGNKAKLIRSLSMPRDGMSGTVSKKNPLRNEKNLFICMATLATRAAVEGGLSAELAYTLSDSYIQQVEDINEISEAQTLELKMLCDFTERVKLSKEHNYSKTIIRCQNYIFNHLYEVISLPQLAKEVNMNTNYLSVLFKKEVHVPISEYVHKQKIEEAKKLLVMSDYSLLEICTCLNFTNQSYFTKVFKKFTGITPKQYRNTHFNI